VIFLENEISTASRSTCRRIPEFVLPIGKAKIERLGQGRHHRRLSIMVGKGACRRREELAKQGIDAEGH
jgi:pyruvate dehydrogenase E1 component beta subunit